MVPRARCGPIPSGTRAVVPPMPTPAANLDKGAPASEEALAFQNGLAGASGKKKRLAFVIAHLGPGGAQRVAVNAANALVARGFDVHVTILGHRPIVYWVDPRIVFHSSSPVTTDFPASDVGSLDVGSLDDELEQIAPVKKEGGRSAKPTSLLGRYVKPYLHPRVLAFGLKTAGPVFSVIWQGRRTIWLRRTIRKIKPDAVLSFLTQ